MITVKTPKEITDYKEKIAGGMSLRQLITLGIAVAICVPIFILCSVFFSFNTASTVVMFAAIPFLAFGFYEPKGYPLEKYIFIIYKHRFTPQKRYYKTQNLLALYDENFHSDVNSLLREKGTTTSASSEITILSFPQKNSQKNTVKNARLEILKAKKEARCDVKASIKAHTKKQVFSVPTKPPIKREAIDKYYTFKENPYSSFAFPKTEEL